MNAFSTKAQTLEDLSCLVKNAKILPQVAFTVEQYKVNQISTFAEIQKVAWMKQPVIVRSSAYSEDSIQQSLAGHFTSILDVRGENKILEAIEKVISSFDRQHPKDQIFIQPMLQEVAVSGVIFSKNPSSGAPYILINFDDFSGSTTSVTSGSTNQVKSYCQYRYTNVEAPPPLDRIIKVLLELETLFQIDTLDVEFAFTKSKELFLLQVRPLLIPTDPCITNKEHTFGLQKIAEKIDKSYGLHPYLYGKRTMYGIMPDWNPAEIIGVRPRPLSLSLYKEIITDQIWAYQRDNYGYCNVRSFPLLLTFHGIPYVDVRVSFNSFIPKSLDKKIAEKLVNYYLDRLEKFPNFHDKIEFEIIFSCYTLDLPDRLSILEEYGFDRKEQKAIALHLKNLTNTIIDPKNGLWCADIKKIQTLVTKTEQILSSTLDPISRIYWLLEDCKRYGTLPFAGLARAGFIAIQLLKSLVEVKILNLDEYHNFLGSLNTISSRIQSDLQRLDKKKFLQKYGHLRPGTYDILSLRYDEAPEQYFDWEKPKCLSKLAKVPFSLSLHQMKKVETLLQKHGFNHNIISFFDFIKSAIEGREYAKFVFSKSLSHVLTEIKKVGQQLGYSPEMCSFMHIDCIKKLYNSSSDVDSVFQKSIDEGKVVYAMTKQLLLPPLICHPEQVFSFSMPLSEPNYITLKKIQGHTATTKDEKCRLKGSILLIESADPGYDWIFSHEIAGFITIYGGMNSHMAIRACELGIPAVIGAGEVLYHQWKLAHVLEIDCANRQVQVLR